MKKILITMGGTMMFFCVFILPVSAITANYVPYWDGVDYADSNIFYDNVSNRLGIGTANPDEKMHITEGTLLVDNPGNPTLEGSLNNLGGACSVDISNNFAFVTSYGSDSLSVIDISDPANPVLTGSVTHADLNGAFSVHVAGKYAYVASYESDGLSIIDISNPSNPVLVGSLLDDTIMDSTRSVYVSGQYAYVTGRNSNSLAIIDVSDPANPVLAGTLFDGDNLYGALSVYVSGNFAYIASFYSDNLAIVNISDPVNPVLTGSFKHGYLNGANSVYVSGKHAYVTSFFADRLSIIDISDPANPGLEGSLQDDININGAFSVHVAGKYAYVAGNESDGLSIIDISDSANPVLTSSLLDGTNLNGIYEVHVSGKHAYVVNSISRTLAILDIGGADIHAANIGNIESDNITVNDNIDIGNDLSARNIAASGSICDANGCIGGGGADNLGDHTATQNINLSGNWLSGDGDGEGIFIDSDGKIGIGTATPTEVLDVTGNIAASGTVCDVNGCIGDAGSSVWSVNGDDAYYDTGNVGIGTSSPEAPLHVAGDDGVLFTGTYGTGSIPATGDGARMMWYPGKAAFRAGYINETQWDDSNIGNYSVAMGSYTIASGESSTSLGRANIASGNYSSTSGYSNTASGQSATALGQSAVASGSFSTSLGAGNDATGAYSVAMGGFNYASGERAIAMGDDTESTGYGSTAMGGSTLASGPDATAMGTSTTASGNSSVAMGNHSTAQSYTSLVLGRYNNIEGDIDSWVDTDPLFVIGNGTSNANTNNALTVFKNGNMTVDGSVCDNNGCIGDGGGGGSLWSEDGSNIYFDTGNIGVGTTPSASFAMKVDGQDLVGLNIDSNDNFAIDATSNNSSGSTIRGVSTSSTGTAVSGVNSYGGDAGSFWGDVEVYNGGLNIDQDLGIGGDIIPNGEICIGSGC